MYFRALFLSAVAFAGVCALPNAGTAPKSIASSSTITSTTPSSTPSTTSSSNNATSSSDSTTTNSLWSVYSGVAYYNTIDSVAPFIKVATSTFMWTQSVTATVSNNIIAIPDTATIISTSTSASPVSASSATHGPKSSIEASTTTALPSAYTVTQYYDTLISSAPYIKVASTTTVVTPTLPFGATAT